MKEYLNKIIHADCMDILPELETDSIDLVLTDPPYGIKMSSEISRIGSMISKNSLAKRGDYKSKNWDDEKPAAAVFEEIQRISKNAIIFGGNYFSLPPSPCWLVWDKVNGSSNFADCELAWTNFTTATRKFTFRWNGMLQEDMANKEERIHPTQKPRRLFAQILEKYLPEGGIVLDCYSGSGTTALACHDLGADYQYICIEKDEEYHAASVERLENHKRQGRLF